MYSRYSTEYASINYVCPLVSEHVPTYIATASTKGVLPVHTPARLPLDYTCPVFLLLIILYSINWLVGADTGACCGVQYYMNIYTQILGSASGYASRHITHRSI